MQLQANILWNIGNYLQVHMV